MIFYDVQHVDVDPGQSLALPDLAICATRADCAYISSSESICSCTRLKQATNCECTQCEHTFQDVLHSSAEDFWDVLH